MGQASLSVLSMCSRAFLHNCAVHMTLLQSSMLPGVSQWVSGCVGYSRPKKQTLGAWLQGPYQNWGGGLTIVTFLKPHGSCPSEAWRKVLRETKEQGQKDRQGYCMILFLGRHELMSIYLWQGVNNDQSKDTIKLSGWVLLIFLTGV